MKKERLFISLLVAGTMAACNAKPEYEITGQFTDVTADSLYVMVTSADNTGTEYIDTVPMDNGKFAFNLNKNELRSIVLVPSPSEGKKTFEEGYAHFYYMPGETATLSGTIKDMKVKGTGFYAELEAANATLPVKSSDFEALGQECRDRMAKGENEDSVMAYYEEKSAEMSAELSKACKEYIAGHPDSDVSALFVASMGDDYEEGLALLTDRAKEGPAAGPYKFVIARKEAEQKRQEAEKKIQPGLEAPDFTLTDLNGKPLALSSLRGKYVVIDFWGSWCGWCIKGFPEMKKYYAKYKDKMEILGVACGDTDKKWRAAVEKHEVPWLNVLNEKGDNDASTLYAVRGYPTKVVIDPKGKIAKVIVGESPEFYTYLDELFK